MQALSNGEILERALAKARANNPDWKPILLNRPEDLLQMGHENIVLFERGFAQAFWGEAPHIVVPTDSGGALVQAIDTRLGRLLVLFSTYERNSRGKSSSRENPGESRCKKLLQKSTCLSLTLQVVLIYWRGGITSKNLPWPQTSSRIWSSSYELRPGLCVPSLSRSGAHTRSALGTFLLMKRTASAVGRSFLCLARLSQDSNMRSRNFTDDALLLRYLSCT